MFRKTLHILLAALVFVSSSGLVFSKHYCRGELKRVAVFAEAASCHAAAAKKTCPRHRAAAPENLTKNNCCATVTDFLKNADEQLSTSVELPTGSLFSVIFPPAHPLLLAPPVIVYRPADYQHYKPPLLVRDLPVRLQTFLC